MRPTSPSRYITSCSSDIFCLYNDPGVTQGVEGNSSCVNSKSMFIEVDTISMSGFNTVIIAMAVALDDDLVTLNRVVVVAVITVKFRQLHLAALICLDYNNIIACSEFSIIVDQLAAMTIVAISVVMTLARASTHTRGSLRARTSLWSSRALFSFLSLWASWS